MLYIRKISSLTYINPKYIPILDDLEKIIFDYNFVCEKNEVYWWLVYNKSKIVGFAGMYYYTTLAKPSAFLYRSGLLKEARGFGIQKKLIKIREKQAKKDGYHRMITYTSKDNYPSANSLIGCGYKLYCPPTLWGLKDGLYFQKFI